SLVALVPRMLPGVQLWSQVSEPLRTKALVLAADLDATYLDAATTAALGNVIAESSDHSLRLFRRSYSTRGIPRHPLNAEFLDVTLRPLTPASRDLKWTEWLRSNVEDLLVDLSRLEA